MGNWYDVAMVVSNAQNETAIVIRRDGATVVFVRFRTGRLAAERMTESAFRGTWHESTYPLRQALDRLLEHASVHGSTQEALKGLNKLKERDQNVVASLF